MPLIMKFRRFWAIFVFLVLLLPTIGFFAPDLPAPVRTVAAPEEEWWMKASGRLDPYINNVFGFRGAVLAAHDTYGRWLGGGENERVLKGENGALFIRDEWALEQSIGQVIREQRVEDTVKLAGQMDQKARAHGGTFVMSVPPNSQTVNPENLPAYARDSRKSPTEYDLLAKALKDRGIHFVDLRETMAQAKKDGPVYRNNDTHWNWHGALEAFNATMRGIGHPELAYDPKDVLGERYLRDDGDLVRLSGGTKADKPDVDFQPKGALLPKGNLKPLEGIAKPLEKPGPFPPQVFETGHAGPRIMVVGDSFTQNFWRGLLADRSSAYVWIHHNSCGFDQGVIDRFKPDILIYAPTERSFPCKPQHRP
ncbi:MAG: hypothetical protein AB7E29_12090 [Xanthobacter sp.]